MKKTAHLTPGEFELMEILWPLGEASVKAVWSRVNPERGLAYTTVMTVLEKMHRKGILAQRKKGKAYLYSALLGREQALQGIIDHVRDAYFKGSQSELAEFVEKNCASVPLSPAKPPSGVEEPQAGEPPK
jgi:predicted transcriptional regulator